MTNREIVEQLNRLYGMKEREREEKTAKLSISVGYAVRKNIGILERPYKAYLESLKTLQEKYLNEGGNELQFKNDDERKEYSKELNELLSIDNSGMEFHKIQFKDLERCTSLSMEDQDALFFMIEE